LFAQTIIKIICAFIFALLNASHGKAIKTILAVTEACASKSKFQCLGHHSIRSSAVFCGFFLAGISRPRHENMLFCCWLGLLMCQALIHSPTGAFDVKKTRKQNNKKIENDIQKDN
jgi:hypothetical protein